MPFLALILEQITLRGTLAIDEWLTWIPPWPLGVSGTMAAIQTIISLILAFIVFTFGSMLIAVQIASGQLTPRIIATTLLRDNVIRFTVGLFIFTLLFAIGTISRIETSQPRFTIWFCVGLGLVSLTAFLYLIDYSARLLRPGSVLWRVADQGFRVIDQVYPNKLRELVEPTVLQPHLGTPDRVIEHSGTSAVVIAVDVRSLMNLAQRADGVISFAAHIGDFVATGQSLFLLYGGAIALDDSELRNTTAFGPERTIEQDSAFAFRVIVDIAIKALSKAINDPTTAVLAIDQLHRLLRRVGERNLRNEYVTDSEGKVRVIIQTPDWDNFVQLTCREIRLYGAGNFQIARRLRAMLENLRETLPEIRRPALAQELNLLDRSINIEYQLEEDKALCRIPDSQGLGGGL